MTQTEIQAYQAALELSYNNAFTNFAISIVIMFVFFGTMMYIASRD